MKRLITLTAALGLFLSTASPASVIFGNPKVKIVLDSGSPVWVNAVRGYSCPGQETITLDSQLS